MTAEGPSAAAAAYGLRAPNPPRRSADVCERASAARLSREQVLAMLARVAHDDVGSLLLTEVDDERRAEIRDTAVAMGLETVERRHARAVGVTARRRRPQGLVLVVTAGTSDLPVAEEALIAASLSGAGTELIADAGVAGLHRLTAVADRLGDAGAVVVVAGMEGALASVVGRLTARPVIACPTSVGYGASFGGVAALLGMLAGRTPGVACVDIDDGAGAGFVAARIALAAAGATAAGHVSGGRL